MQLALDRRPTVERRALALVLKGGRPGDRIADKAIVEAGADRIEDSSRARGTPSCLGREPS